MGRRKDDESSTSAIKNLAVIILGIMIILMSAKEVKNSFTTPPYLYDLTTSQITDGAYVQEDICAALDSFMYEETTRTKYGIEISSRISAYYYIIPVLTADGDDLYMAIEVNANDDETMLSICENTISYLLGEIDESQYGLNTYHIRGNVRRMDSEEIQYMVEWFQDTEYFGTTNAAEIQNYILPVMVEKYEGTSARIMLVAGILIILFGISQMKSDAKNYRIRKKGTSNSTYQSGYDNGYSAQNTYQQGNMNQPQNMYQQTPSYNQNDMYSEDNTQTFGNSQPFPGTSQTFGNSQPFPGTSQTLGNSQPFPGTSQTFGNSQPFPGTSQTFGNSQPFPGTSQTFGNSQQQPEGQYQSKIMQMQAALYKNYPTNQQNTPSYEQPQDYTSDPYAAENNDVDELTRDTSYDSTYNNY